MNVWMNLGFVATAALAFASACGAADKIDNAFDCSAICKRYSSCFDAKYDVDKCSDKCRSDSSNDKDYQRKADICDKCIDDRSCTSATFNCATSCVGIVP